MWCKNEAIDKSAPFKIAPSGLVISQGGDPDIKTYSMVWGTIKRSSR